MAVDPKETLVKAILKITALSGAVAAGYLNHPNLITPGVTRFTLMLPPMPGPMVTAVALATVES